MFDFKQFHIEDSHSAMKVGTDSVLLGAWTDTDGARRILDLGCGSGLLALMMAQRCPDAEIAGVEIDPDAAADAVINFAASPWQNRMRVICADALTAALPEPCDLVVCNPPYFANGLLSPDDRRAMARHGMLSLSPEGAVDVAARILSDHGSFAMVTPADMEDALVFHAEMARLRLWRLCRVSTRRGKAPARLLWQFCRQPRPTQITAIDVRDCSNAYTHEYIDLTSDFYLHL